MLCTAQNCTFPPQEANRTLRVYRQKPLRRQFASPYVGMGNDPVNGVDPDGRNAVMDEWVINLAAGTVTKVGDRGGDQTDYFYLFLPLSDEQWEGPWETYTMEKTTAADPDNPNILRELVKFPSNGANWGRYGVRDAAEDGWMNPETAANFLGLLHEISEVLPGETVYFDDMSSRDLSNLGHRTHRRGNDVDIRYISAGNGPNFGSDENCYYCWNTLEALFPEADFWIKNTIFMISAERWGFNQNYAYPSTPALYGTRYAAHYGHRHHLHIGRR